MSHQCVTPMCQSSATPAQLIPLDLLSQLINSLGVCQRRYPASELVEGRHQIPGALGGRHWSLLLQLAQLPLHEVEVATQAVVRAQLGGHMSDAAR